MITLDPALEDRIAEGVEHTDRGMLDAHVAAGRRGDLPADRRTSSRSPRWRERPPIVLVSPQIRAGLKQMTAARLPRLVVLSYHEITRDTQIESLALVDDAHAVRAA